MRRPRHLVLVVLPLLAHCTVARAPIEESTPDVPACTSPMVMTSSGAACGLQATGVQAYLGIPYAESTAGNARWKKPEPYAPRPGVRNATAFGPICPQPHANPALEQSEDCLSVNVWTPASTPPAGGWPVMAFIHGGAFIEGGSRAGSLDGGRLAARGPVVVVSFNYRLGALGFLGGIEGLEGNYGLLDQQLALRWVRDNAAAFNGDPLRVTIFGESAGAMSVGLHLIAPASRGLFRAAILESNPYGIPYKSPSEARAFAEILWEELGCSDVDCMRRASATEVVGKQMSERLVLDGLLEGLTGELVWAPTADGDAVPSQPVAVEAKVPILIGTNRDEGALFVGPYRIKLPFETREVARLEYEAFLHLLFASDAVDRVEAEPRYAPASGDNTEVLARLLTDYLFTCANRHVMNDARGAVFGYRFAHRADFDAWPGIPLCAPATGRVCHAFELPFVFDNPVDVRLATAPPKAYARFSPGDAAIADAMAGYWTTFAATLNPNRPGLPEWPPYRADTPQIQVFERAIAPSVGLDAECSFWDSIGYESRGLFERMGIDHP